MSSYQILIKD